MLGLGLGLWSNQAAASGGGGATTYNAFKLHTTAVPLGSGVNIGEFGYSMTNGGANAALGGGVTASASSTTGGFPASNVLDGSTATCWASNGAPPQDLILTLTTPIVLPFEFIIGSWDTNQSLVSGDFTITCSSDGGTTFPHTAVTISGGGTYAGYRRYTAS